MRAGDTIAAPATPPASGGVGVVRLSGPLARAVLKGVFRPSAPGFTDFRPRMLHRGRLVDAEGRTLDDALAVFMPGPRSFTGEDVAEIHCHGGLSLIAALLERVYELGARPAEPGEFSRRAFLNGRMDLTRAEAVAELIAAPGKEAVLLSAAKLDGLLERRVTHLRERLEDLRLRVCACVDFEEEADCLPPDTFVRGLEEINAAARELLAGYRRCRVWHEGALVTLAGRVNVGKSSLMNALLGRERALVTDIPGTTRDFLEERLVLDGLPARLVDTAGLRENADAVEALGMAAGRRCMEEADLVVLVLDGRHGLTGEDAATARQYAGRLLIAWNKTDLAPCGPEGIAACAGLGPLVSVSAKTGAGLENLAAEARRLIAAAGGAGSIGSDAVSLNLRQARALESASAELEQGARAVRAGLPYDVCALHLDTAGAALREITGLDGSDELLNRVFASFCIGK